MNKCTMNRKLYTKQSTNSAITYNYSDVDLCMKHFSNTASPARRGIHKFNKIFEQTGTFLVQICLQLILQIKLFTL